MNVLSHNRAAWDRRVDAADRWTLPVSEEIVQRARRGEFEIALTDSSTPDSC